MDAFFVLSGLVVAASCTRSTGLLTFYAARPCGFSHCVGEGATGPFLACLLPAHIVLETFSGGLLLGLRTLLSPADALGIVSSSLLGLFDANPLNLPLWTLAVEVCASLLKGIALSYQPSTADPSTRTVKKRGSVSKKGLTA